MKEEDKSLAFVNKSYIDATSDDDQELTLISTQIKKLFYGKESQGMATQIIRKSQKTHSSENSRKGDQDGKTYEPTCYNCNKIGHIQTVQSSTTKIKLGC